MPVLGVELAPRICSKELPFQLWDPSSRRHRVSHRRADCPGREAASPPRCDDREMARGRLQLLALTATIWTVGCGGDAVTHREATPDAKPDARGTPGDASNADVPTKPPVPTDATVSSGRADSSSSGDANSTTSADANDGSIADANPDLCTAVPTRDPDAGTCLGIYYATVAQLVFWVEDRSAADGGSRITLAKDDVVRAGGHTYGYFGNSLITSGSRVEIHLDVDGVRDALSFGLYGCAPKTGNSTWDYPATLTRTCSGCASTSTGRHYSVDESRVDGGGMIYTFDADEPARSCGAGFDLLSFTTRPV